MTEVSCKEWALKFAGSLDEKFKSMIKKWQLLVPSIQDDGSDLRKFFPSHLINLLHMNYSISMMEKKHGLSNQTNFFPLIKRPVSPFCNEIKISLVNHRLLTVNRLPLSDRGIQGHVNDSHCNSTSTEAGVLTAITDHSPTPPEGGTHCHRGRGRAIIVPPGEALS
ncbi:hypothetical protein AVEN_61164-1 [Araneus ventricosus]|uniref:Uncharacterized protein n=1 Tax=Araneus ventricosus TaxID=182803 RepID=A0A4Y2UX10_ARAVE|nr:hypothetical protein AVEN_61164-1 [Araneus ventricosus]